MVELVPHEGPLPPEQVGVEDRLLVRERGEPADPFDQRPERREVGGDLALDRVEAGEEEVGGEERLAGPGEPDGRGEPGQVVREGLELPGRRLPPLPVGPVLYPGEERGERVRVEVPEEPLDRPDPVEDLDERGQVVDRELGRDPPGPGPVEDPLDPRPLQLAEVGQGEEDHERQRPRGMGQVHDQPLALAHGPADGLEAGPEAGLRVAVRERDRGPAARFRPGRRPPSRRARRGRRGRRRRSGPCRPGRRRPRPSSPARRPAARRSGASSPGAGDAEPPSAALDDAVPGDGLAAGIAGRGNGGSAPAPAAAPRPGSRRRGRRPAPRGSRRRRPGGGGRTRRARPGSPCRPGRARGGRRSRGRSGRSRSPAAWRRGRRARSPGRRRCRRACRSRGTGGCPCRRCSRPAPGARRRRRRRSRRRRRPPRRRRRRRRGPRGRRPRPGTRGRARGSGGRGIRLHPRRSVHRSLSHQGRGDEKRCGAVRGG